MTVKLTDRVILVTGSGQGVGRQIILDAAASGARGIVVNDFYLDRAEEVAEEVRAMGVEAIAVSGDVADYGVAEKTIQTAHSSFGCVDILVNNAGNAGPAPTAEMDRPFWEQTPSDWDGYLGTNLFGVLNFSRHVLPGMIKRGHGRIVNMISDAGRVGEPSREAYSAAKAGTAGFTRGLAASVGRYGITANCVSLSLTHTPRTAARIADDRSLQKMLKHYIIRRPGTPHDVSRMVLFLASDESSWITGQTYPVNGGYSFAL